MLLAGAVLALALSQAASAQTRTAEQIYREYLYTSGLVTTEVRVDLEKGGIGFPDARPGTNFDKSQKLLEELKANSKAGDASAMFHEGLIRHSDGAMYLRNLNIQGMKQLSDEAFRESLALFKRAGEGGDASGYYNVAVQYQNGQGVLKSNLAAAEWYYRAGTAYLRAGDRENALASLEGMQAADKDSALTKKLDAALRKSGPQ